MHPWFFVYFIITDSNIFIELWNGKCCTGMFLCQLLRSVGLWRMARLFLFVFEWKVASISDFYVRFAQSGNCLGPCFWWYDLTKARHSQKTNCATFLYLQNVYWTPMATVYCFFVCWIVFYAQHTTDIHNKRNFDVESVTVLRFRLQLVCAKRT